MPLDFSAPSSSHPLHQTDHFIKLVEGNLFAVDLCQLKWAFLSYYFEIVFYNGFEFGLDIYNCKMKLNEYNTSTSIYL